MGDKMSCFEAGRMLLDRYHPRRKQPDIGAEAMTHFHRGCDKTFEKESCHALSEFYRNGHMGAEKDPAKALKYAERACEYQKDEACVNAYLMHKNGDGVPKNEKKAEEFYKRGVASIVWNMKMLQYCQEGIRRTDPSKGVNQQQVEHPEMTLNLQEESDNSIKREQAQKTESATEQS